jgi:hypothetical protein
VIKTAMIISSGRRGDKIINELDLKESMDVVLPLVVPTKRVSQSLRKDDISAVQKRGMVLTYISNRPQFAASRKEILKNLGLKLDHEDLDKVVNFMLQAQVVNINNHGGETIYTLKADNPKVAKWIEQFRS